MFNLFQNKCSNCGRDIPRDVNFCPYCGAATASGRIKCGNCGAENQANATFCRQCGQPLSQTAAPVMENNRWRRSDNDFAARIEVSDLRGILAKELIIEPGTRAMLVADGQNIGVVGPGRYTLQTFIDSLPVLNTLLDANKSITAMLADTGDVDLDFDLQNLFTRDPLKISAVCKVVVQLTNPVLFITNLMKDRRAFPLGELRGYLQDEVLDAAREFIGARAVDELARNLELKKQMEVAIDAHLNRTLERTGLRFVQIRTLDYKLERYDAVNKIRQDYFLQIGEHEAKNAGRKRLLDAQQEGWLHDLAEETAKTELHEKRVALWDRMRRSVLSDKMNQVQTEQEFEKFVHDVDKEKLLRADEMQTLKRDFVERRDDHDKQRAFFIAKADMERDFELKQIEFAQRRDLTTQQAEFEIELERKRLEGKLAFDARRWEAELLRQKADAEFRREEQRVNDFDRRERELKDAQTANEIKLANAKTAADVSALEREQDRLDAELGILLLEKMKAVRRKDELERQQMDLERKEQELALRLREEQARAEIEMQKARQVNEQEIKRLETYALMSTEALIVATDTDKGKLLAELKRTETLKGFSEEQILAMAADKSPQVAQAFVEKFRAIAASSPEQQKQLQEMYEKMLAEQKASSKDLREAQEANAKRLQEMFDKGLDSQRDTATAFARSPGQPTVVVTPGAGQPTVVQNSATLPSSSEVWVCKSCHRSSPVGTKFCSNCGTAFF